MPKRLRLLYAVRPKEIRLDIPCSLIHHIIRFLYLLLSWEVYINRLILMCWPININIRTDSYFTKH